MVENEDSLALAVQLVQEKHIQEIEKVRASYQNNKTKILEDRLKTLENENNFYLEVIHSLQKETFDCPVCINDHPNEKMVLTGCLHILCVDCYEQLTKKVYHAECPYCRTDLDNNQVIVHPRLKEAKENKLSKLIEAILQVPEGEKIILFTQFHSFVERLESIFNQLDVSYVVLKGDPTEINIALNKFKEVPEIKILLMSIEQSVSGINVTAVNHVFFAHPIFGMSFDKAAITYNQCIGRAYRIGQKKKVYVKMFVTENSIEEDILPSFWKY